jgi:hypothetical protein
MSCLIVLCEKERNEVHDPVGDDGCTASHDSSASLAEAIVIFELNLKKREIAEDVLVVFIVLDGHCIGFLCCFIVLLSFEKDSLYVPASEIDHIFG